MTTQPVGVIHIIECAWCKAPLRDAVGNPRWWITAQFQFVCLRLCRRRTRKAGAR